ncbi:uncharacterized protein LOC124274870 [Haliotis rubra]|uniref:uncharacterized protein LOC124274870 n=1 Tax=Haliotis rubra TaxID=36100 RepID=UPI001EE54CCE|nr:uncharacterized protein LOC124274870 [Haliotis rubra]
MVDLLDDFLCGRYRKCVEYLEGCEDGKFQPTQVQVQSNKAVCKLLMTLSCSPVDAVKTLRTSLNELEKYLIQIQSFPPEMLNMETEMTIVYNSVYLNLLLHTHCGGGDDGQAVMSQCGAVFSKSLARVLAAVKHIPCPRTPADSPDQAVMSQLHELLQYSQILHAYGITSPICFAGCAWSCLQMLVKKEKEALTCLESLTQMLAETGDTSQMPVNSAGLRLCVSVPGDKVRQRASHTETLFAPDLVGLLKGLCHYKLAYWGLSRECLSGIHGDSLRTQVKYVIGLCYLKEGKADDCEYSASLYWRLPYTGAPHVRHTGRDAPPDGTVLCPQGENIFYISVLEAALHRSSSCPSHRSRTLHLMGQCYANKVRDAPPDGTVLCQQGENIFYISTGGCLTPELLMSVTQIQDAPPDGTVLCPQGENIFYISTGGCLTRSSSCPSTQIQGAPPDGTVLCPQGENIFYISVLEAALHGAPHVRPHRSRTLHLMGQCYAHKVRIYSTSLLEAALHRSSSCPSTQIQDAHLMGQCYAHKVRIYSTSLYWRLPYTGAPHVRHTGPGCST